MELLTANFAPFMFAGLILFLLLGFPVAFSLGACGLFFGLIGIELGVFPASIVAWLPQRLIGIMANDTLLAVPFFTLMGLILERSGMAEDLLDTVGQVFGPVRGGLALAVIFVGALLAATTGVVAASVISMGLISLPIMLRYGYNRPVSAGVIAASGTLAQIIPPSLVLIIMADQLGRSVGDMYKGAFIPAFILVGMYVLFVVALAIFRPAMVPALPPEARTYREPNGSSGYPSLFVVLAISAAVAGAMAHYMPQLHTWWQGQAVDAVPTDEKVVVAMCGGVFVAWLIALINRLLKLGLLSRLAERVTFVLIPPLLLIFLVLGTIFLGVATPTEGGAMGAVGALIMAALRGRMSWSLLKQGLVSTTKLASFVMFILIGSTVFSMVFQAADGHKWVEELLRNLPGGQVGILDLCERGGVFPRVLSRLFRALFHRRAAARAGGGQAGHRPDLVWRAACGEHADLVHAPALRLCAVFPAFGSARKTLHGQGDRQAHGARDHHADLQGRDSLRVDAAGDGGRADRLPGPGDGQPGRAGQGRHGRRGRRDARQPGRQQRLRHGRRRRCHARYGCRQPG
jgi:TRAP-type mannitol/chloroaromatic compound transport system, large permease component